MKRHADVGNKGRKRSWSLWALLGAGAVYVTLTLAAGVGGPSPRLTLDDGLSVNPLASVDPRATYRVTLWETAVVMPDQGEPFHEDVEGALVEFSDRYPNVHVDVTFVPEGELHERLQQAISNGDPPDVVALPEPVHGYPLQVPATPFLPAEPRGQTNDDELLYYAAARDPWTAEGHLWGFPRWIAWEAWAGHDGRLREQQVDVEGAVRYGWTWDDLRQLARRLDGQSARERLALDVRNVTLFAQLVANGGAPWWESAEGPLWSDAVLAEAAGLLRELQAARAFPSPGNQGVFNRAVHFAQREGLLIAPVNAALFTTLQRRLGPEVVLLPVPHHPEHGEVAWLLPSGYAVFRQKTFQGDGHLKVAMELAYFLSRRLGLSTAQKMGFLPASPRDLHPWKDRSDLHYLTRDFLLDYLTHFPRVTGKPSMRAYMPPAEARRALAEAIPSLWVTPSPPSVEAWAKDTYESLRPFMSSTEAR